MKLDDRPVRGFVAQIVDGALQNIVQIEQRKLHRLKQRPAKTLRRGLGQRVGGTNAVKDGETLQIVVGLGNDAALVVDRLGIGERRYAHRRRGTRAANWNCAGQLELPRLTLRPH